MRLAWMAWSPRPIHDFSTSKDLEATRAYGKSGAELLQDYLSATKLIERSNAILQSSLGGLFAIVAGTLGHFETLVFSAPGIA